MLKTCWTAPGMGATVGELRILMGQPPCPGMSVEEEAVIRTALEVEPYLQKLEGYDRERAEIAIDRAIVVHNRKKHNAAMNAINEANMEKEDPLCPDAK